VVAPEAPAGRFFDAPEVDEQPRILTRIDPRLPADLQGRPSDVVIVRVLVSHTGHPFRVTLLRRSRLGPSADEAVIAAVRRWTFSAARKRGEPVSCWYNLAVPLSVG
jgi:TonB family protein